MLTPQATIEGDGDNVEEGQTGTGEPAAQPPHDDNHCRGEVITPITPIPLPEVEGRALRPAPPVRVPIAPANSRCWARRGTRPSTLAGRIEGGL
ncbi:hypothetical protein K523DRAFT_358126 [Schizophyllum commune Tattone D]|nr:hypothetical protein K523DRAFT_358126 [Schizophyllum commune Tattone D]